MRQISATPTTGKQMCIAQRQHIYRTIRIPHQTVPHSSEASYLSDRSTHEKYFAMLEVPSQEKMNEIAQVQQQKEGEWESKRRKSDATERDKAAELIQRNYRGYRERRIMKGMSLSPSTRWNSADESGCAGHDLMRWYS